MEIGTLYPFKDDKGNTVKAPHLCACVTSKEKYSFSDFHYNVGGGVDDDLNYYIMIRNRETGKTFIIPEKDLVLLAIERGIDVPTDESQKNRSRKSSSTIQSNDKRTGTTEPDKTG